MTTERRTTLRNAQAALERASMTEQALRTEAESLDKRVRAAQAEREAAARKVQDARNLMLVHLLTRDDMGAQLIDALTPEHDRRGCSDDDPKNGEGRCARCTLLQATREGYIEGQWRFATTEAQ